MAEQRIPPRPLFSRLTAGFLKPINIFFDWLYHSHYNPFYRSGTLAIGLLFILLGTGFYLLFFYSVSSPYKSLVEIHNQVWLGRWIRSLHRYSTDAALVAVFFHVLQLLAQGKTWGPRTLAWVSGVLLLCALCISTWTGYVMVWDTHGQLVALSGLKMLSAVPFVGSGMVHAFSGEKPLPSSFFFMNLFLHVAIPLGMLFGMWIHTARLARTKWYPIRSIFWGSSIALLLLSVVWPATLAPEANLLRRLGQVPTDWWYNFWVPLQELTSPGFVLSITIASLLLLGSIPWWWKPLKSRRPMISVVDENGCTGCTQCARDCPYEAISMVPHPNGKHMLAEVSPIHCVSCGICAASCAEFAVGPPGRTPFDQQLLVDTIATETSTERSANNVTIVACKHNDGIPAFLENHAKENDALHYVDLNCCGTIHSDTLEKLLSQCGGVVLVGCAARNCVNRDGLDLLQGRLYAKRVPFLSRDIDRSRLVVSSHSELEKTEITQKIEDLQEYLNDTESLPRSISLSSRLAWYAKRSVATTILLAVIALVSQAPMGTESNLALLRVVGSLPGQVSLSCRPLTENERATIPAHMQRKEICEQETVSYRLRVYQGQQQVRETKLLPRSSRGELPLLIMEDIEIVPGNHDIRVELQAENPDHAKLDQHQLKSLEFKANQIEILALSPKIGDREVKR